jgi:glycosyltransferase involved in cell wall biosynthesis
MKRARDWHVAVVVENLPLGVDTRLRKQVRDMVDAGFRVSAITMRDPSNASYGQLPGVRLLQYRPPRESSSTIGYLREYLTAFCWAALLTAKERMRGRIDVLHLCQPPDIYFPLAWAMKWAGSRIVVDQRDLMPELLAQRSSAAAPRLIMRVLHWLERRTQSVADQTICVNDYLRDRLIAAGAEPTRVSIVRNGPVVARAREARPDPTLLRGHAHLVCWAGRIGRQDRVDIVLDVADVVVNDLGQKDCAFVVLGDGECLDELRDLAVRRGLDDWVSFTGWLTEADVFAHLVTADIGLDTSLQVEVSPVKAMEYMALGLPLVSFDLQETRRICEGAGVFVQPFALAKAIVGLLADPAERARLGETGRNRVDAELAWERQRPAYLAAVGPQDHDAPGEPPRGQP